MAHYPTSRFINHMVDQSSTTGGFPNPDPDPLSRTFAALADPTRRAILARLADGEETVNALARPFDMSVQAVSKHLRVLEQAGLITRGRDAQWRPCRLQVAPLDDANDWIERYRDIARDRLDRLDQAIQRIRRSQSNTRGSPAS
jgi:DNA-binding transcriptional ArsR family regulator